MSTTYYSSFELPPIPTGFGGYTGVVVVNSGNYPVQYNFTISDTDVGVDEADAIDGSIYDTIFISNELNSFGDSPKEASIILSPGDSGRIYVMHKPFSTFVVGSEAAGNETASIYVQSHSYKGDFDEQILIDVTGQRVITFPTPDSVKNFYGVKSYNNQNYKIDFYWDRNDAAQINKFNLQSSTNSSFTDPFTYEVFLPIENSEAYLPQYGSYDSTSTTTIKYTVNDLPINDDLYFRIQAVNPDGAGDFTYAKAFDEIPLEGDSNLINGTTASPGDDFLFTVTALDVDIEVEENTVNLDLAKILYEKNGNSYDFSAYSEIRVYLRPKSGLSSATISSNSLDKGAIILNQPADDSFKFGTNISNICKLTIELNNIIINGCNVSDSEEFRDQDFPEIVRGFDEAANINSYLLNLPAARRGGPVFDFDNLDYEESGVTKKFDYYISKDANSSLRAGYGTPAIIAVKKREEITISSINILGIVLPITEIVNVGVEIIASYNIDDHDTEYVGKIYNLSRTNGNYRMISRVGSSGYINSKLDDSSKKAPNIYLNFKNTAFPADDDILFRFNASADIAAQSRIIGTAYSDWDSVDSAYSFKQPSAINVLTPREAYGIKFYELGETAANYGEPSVNKIRLKDSSDAYPNFSTSRDPSYAVFVCALGRRIFEESTNWNRNAIYKHDSIVNYKDMPCIHKFGIYNSAFEDRRVVNFGTNLFARDDNNQFLDQLSSTWHSNILRFYPHFTASLLSSYDVLLDKSPNDVWRVFPNRAEYEPCVPGGEARREDWYRTQFLRGGDIKESNILPNKEFIAYNLGENYEGWTNNSNDYAAYLTRYINGTPFYIKEVEGDPALKFTNFSMLFIEMHTEILNSNNDGSCIVKYVTKINKQVVYETNVNVAAGQLLTSNQYVLELLNSFEKDPLLLPSFLNFNNQAILDTRRPQYLNTPAMRPRLFLFDYVLGTKKTSEDRDKLSSDLVDYYASQYKNILLKSETDLSLLDSATKNYPRFDYPISHPFMNIFIDKKRSVPDSYTDTDNITWGLRSANLEDDTTRMNDSLVYFNQQRTQNL